MSEKKTGRSPMDAALRYLTDRPRTVREMEDRLDELQYGEFEVYSAVERLKELGYLNDRQYGEDFIAGRLRAKPVSKRKLRMQLVQHKLPEELIDELLADVPDETELENVRVVAEKYWRQLSSLEYGKRRESVIRRLVARGFSYDDISSVMVRIMDEEREKGD